MQFLETVTSKCIYQNFQTQKLKLVRIRPKSIFEGHEGGIVYRGKIAEDNFNGNLNKYENVCT